MYKHYTVYVIFTNDDNDDDRCDNADGDSVGNDDACDEAYDEDDEDTDWYRLVEGGEPLIPCKATALEFNPRSRVFLIMMMTMPTVMMFTMMRVRVNWSTPHTHTLLKLVFFVVAVLIQL